MSLRTTLQDALGSLTDSLVREVGVPCAVRRRYDDPLDETPAGHAADEWVRPHDASPLGEPVYLYAAAEETTRRLFGAEAAVTCAGLALLTPIREGDRIRPSAGEYCGRILQVVRRLPDDIGGIATLGLVLRTQNPDTPGWF